MIWDSRRPKSTQRDISHELSNNKLITSLSHNIYETYITMGIFLKLDPNLEYIQIFNEKDDDQVLTFVVLFS